MKERVLRETEGIAREEAAMVEEGRVRRIRGRVVVVKDTEFSVCLFGCL